MLKGIVTAEDAELSLRNGVDGVLVSNHGGRSEESGRSTIEALPEVVGVIGGKVPVLVDSGFRRGSDIFKGIALGADAVCVGLVYVWGLAAFGQAGVERALDIGLLEEASMRFPMSLSPTWRWLLAFLGGTPERSYVEIGTDGLEVRFGWFSQRIPFLEVISVAVHARTVPWYAYRIGWRTNLRGGVALVGSAENLVKLELRAARRVSLMGIPTTMRELYVSLEDPDAFLRAVLPHVGK